MHVYTPPGYETGTTKYPVFYCCTCRGQRRRVDVLGRAGFILDNLIAAKKAKPMIVVMPAATHRAGRPRRRRRAQCHAGVREGLHERRDAVRGKALPSADGPCAHRDCGTLDGRNQTLHIAIPKLDKFSYVGVFSSGLFGAFPELVPAGRGGAPAAGPAAASATAPAAAPAPRPHPRERPVPRPARRSQQTGQGAHRHARQCGAQKGLKVLLVPDREGYG